MKKESVPVGSLYTPFRTKYTNRPSGKGESEFSPSITQPDLAFSIEELVSAYAVGNLPSFGQFQPWLDDSYDEDDTSQDFGFGGDKAQLLENFLEANKLRRDIFDRIKERYSKGKAENPDYTAEEACTVDGINLNEV